MADAETPQPTMRAGFWRRALAISIDLALIALVVTIAGVLLFGPTDGRVRIGGALIDVTRCSSVDPQQLVLANPPPFHITNARRCTKSFLGLVHDRTLQVSEVTRSGAITYTRGMTYRVDADGRVAQASYIDTLIFGPFCRLRAVAGMAFRPNPGQAHHAHPGAIAGRRTDRFRSSGQTLRDLLSALGAAGAATHAAIDVRGKFFLAFASSAMIWMLWVVVVFTALVYVVNFVQTTRRRELPWHDRWAATEVVRD